MAVGLCTYNGAKRIGESLEALAKIDRCGGRVRQIVIVDNRSSDNTADVVRRFIAEHPHAGIRLEHEPKPGKAEAIDRLFQSTAEPIVALLDDDCVPDAGWARGLLEAMEAQPRAGVVGGRVVLRWMDGPTKLAEVYRRSLGEQDLGAERMKLAGAGEFVAGASIAVRREAIMESGWLSKRTLTCLRGPVLSAGEDAEMCLMIRRRGWEIWYEGSSRLEHCIPGQRQTKAYLAKLRESICRCEPVLKWLAHERPDERWAMGELRRARRLWIKTMLFDWRPTRRMIRLAERAGRVRGWRQLAQSIDALPR